jgi:hypothetical protein
MAAIPDEIMRHLHDANARFHQAALRLADLDKLGLTERDALRSALRAAQQDIDLVTRQIDDLLKSPNAPAS